MTGWLGAYVGIPYADAGATRDGCNCWGLVCLVLSEQCGIELPAYAEITANHMTEAARQMSHDCERPPWRKVECPQTFDVALMTAMHGITKIVGHVGVMSGENEVLHTWRATGAVNMPISHRLIRFKLLGFYRHESLLNG